MKTIRNKRFFVIFIFAILLFLLSIFFLQYTQNNGKGKLIYQPITSVIPGLPVHLSIPTINIDANIQHVGLTSDGNMDVPNNINDVGWFNLGSRPGEKGSAVISGHVNGKNGEAGVFSNLSKLKKGDTGTITDDKGTILTFIIQNTHLYDPGYAEEIFSTNDKAHLNFITCDGLWDANKKSYTKRLVVFADIMP
jgi:LPXTG-site transpeptidase (sortase) family protein